MFIHILQISNQFFKKFRKTKKYEKVYTFRKNFVHKSEIYI